MDVSCTLSAIVSGTGYAQWNTLLTLLMLSVVEPQKVLTINMEKGTAYQ
jgi:hypothetical protein